MKAWLLVDYDGSGFHEIQANDEHPQRDAIDDEMAVAIARKEATKGHKDAIRAVAIHDRDGPKVAEIRSRIYGGNWPTF